MDLSQGVHDLLEMRQTAVKSDHFFRPPVRPVMSIEILYLTQSTLILMAMASSISTTLILMAMVLPMISIQMTTMTVFLIS
jgi:hypothetical protein